MIVKLISSGSSISSSYSGSTWIFGQTVRNIWMISWNLLAHKRFASKAASTLRCQVHACSPWLLLFSMPPSKITCKNNVNKTNLNKPSLDEERDFSVDASKILLYIFHHIICIYILHTFWYFWEGFRVHTARLDVPLNLLFCLYRWQVLFNEPCLIGVSWFSIENSNISVLEWSVTSCFASAPSFRISGALSPSICITWKKKKKTTNIPGPNFLHGKSRLNLFCWLSSYDMPWQLEPLRPPCRTSVRARLIFGRWTMCKASQGSNRKRGLLVSGNRSSNSQHRFLQAKRIGMQMKTIEKPTTFKMWLQAKMINYFTSSDPHRDIILKHIRHKFWHSFCPSVSRFHQNYPLLLVPSPGSGPSSDHCDLSSQTDSNWLSLCLIQNNFRRPGVSRRLSVSRRPGVSRRLGVWRRLGAWKLRFERYKTKIWRWLRQSSGA